MVDTKYYFENVSPGSKKSLGILDDPEVAELDVREERPKGWTSHSVYGHYDSIKPTQVQTLEDEQYLICSDRVWGFVLKAREWGKSSKNVPGLFVNITSGPSSHRKCLTFSVLKMHLEKAVNVSTPAIFLERYWNCE
jgi:hypothetical protein